MNVTYTDGTSQTIADQPFAQGTQGAIYKSVDGRHVVKLYNPQSITPDRAKQIEGIIGQYNAVGKEPNKDPYWDELYTWPDKVVRSPRLGVRMRFVGDLTRMDHFFYKVAYDNLPLEKKGWWIGRVAAAIKLARAVHHMSTLGLCHSDLSDKNVLVDAFDGRMTILDCDSIVIPGVIPADVLGTPGYMAPELVTRKQREPSVVTDRHALAVLLYRWLLYKHPLYGPKQHSLDTEIDEALMQGEKALWIEHPTDTSNRPKPLRLTTEMLTPRMKHLFHRAFVEGLHTPGLRPTADLWEDALVEMFDRILPCANPACAQRFFVAQQVPPLRCTNCNTPLSFPAAIPFLRLTHPVQRRPGVWQQENDAPFGRYVVGWPERPLYAWHTQPSIKPSPDAAQGIRLDVRPVAFIRYDPVTRMWYLQNDTLPNLRAGKGNDPHINWKRVPPGQMVPLEAGVHLQLGDEHVARRASVEMMPVK